MVNVGDDWTVLAVILVQVDCYAGEAGERLVGQAALI